MSFNMTVLPYIGEQDSTFPLHYVFWNEKGDHGMVRGHLCGLEGQIHSTQEEFVGKSAKLQEQADGTDWPITWICSFIFQFWGFPLVDIGLIHDQLQQEAFRPDSMDGGCIPTFIGQYRSLLS